MAPYVPARLASAAIGGISANICPSQASLRLTNLRHSTFDLIGRSQSQFLEAHGGAGADRADAPASSYDSHGSSLAMERLC
jgi:hypothetical protein